MLAAGLDSVLTTASLIENNIIITLASYKLTGSIRLWNVDLTSSDGL